MHGATEGLTERRIEADPGSELTVTGHAGSINVRGDDDAAIRVRFRGESLADLNGPDPVDVSRDGDRVAVRLNPQAGVLDLDMELRVPYGCRLRVNAIDGEVGIHGVRGPVAVETVGGNVEVLEAVEHCSLETVNGDITLGDCSGDISLTTVDGDVSCHRLEGTLRATITNGDVRLTGSMLRTINLRAINGDLTVETSLATDGTYRLTSTNGEIRLLVPAGTGATVHMKTQDGDVRADLPTMQVISSDKRNWHGVLGGGGAHVYLESVNGDLRMRQSAGAGYDSRSEVSLPRIPVPPAPPAPIVPPVPPIPPADPVSAYPAAPSTAPSAHEDAVAILSRLERGEISIEEAMGSLDELNY
jgi:DUF4097 and DUF4098 domain-containing protein YvlB